jgi:fructuronate reductase
VSEVPPRVVHLGLGAFARAHQAWYTHRADDTAAWPIAAFGGRTSELADALAARGGRYTLVTRGATTDAFETVTSITSAHPAADQDAWLAHLADPAVAVVTVTVTEAGWHARGNGRSDAGTLDQGLDRDHPAVAADVDALRRDLSAAVATAPGRLVAGLAARRGADGGPLAVVSCDNLPANGDVAAAVVRDLAEAADPTLRAWVEGSVSFVSTVVDRITPRTTAADVAAVARATGVDDPVPVVTEPFSEWVLAGAFPGGRPGWDLAGAQVVDDVGPFARRKLWLLNGAHSLLAYLGSIRGHATVDAAMADEVCAGAVRRWWAGARRHLDPAGTSVAELDAYAAALAERFANPRIAHRLDQIAADGSQKLPVRVLPLLGSGPSGHGHEPEGDHESGAAATTDHEPGAAGTIVAAWLCHLRGAGAPVVDAEADRYTALAAGPLPDATRRVLDALDAGRGDDMTTVVLVADTAERIERTGAP